MYELPRRVQSHILPGEAQSLSQLVQCFGGWIFVCCLIYDNPDGLQGGHITYVCWLVILWYKVGKSFGHHACMKCAPPFPLQGFPTFFGDLSPYRCARNFDLYSEVEIFLPLCFVELLSIYLQLNFDNISHTVCEKTAMHSLGCLLRDRS